MAFTVNTGSSVPIYKQLVSQIREAVARGELTPDARLPSVRQLGEDLVVNPNTVARAYTELERDGILVSRPGLGVFVAQPRTELTRDARVRRLVELLDSFLTEAVHLGFTADELMKTVRDRLTEFQWPAADEADGKKKR